MIWLPYAVGSAVFAGLTAILAKVGIRHTPSNLATAIRTAVVLVFAWRLSWRIVVIGGALSSASAPPEAVGLLIVAGTLLMRSDCTQWQIRDRRALYATASR